MLEAGSPASPEGVGEAADGEAKAVALALALGEGGALGEPDALGEADALGSAVALGAAVAVGAAVALGDSLSVGAGLGAATTVNFQVARSTSPSSAEIVVDLTSYSPGARSGTSTIDIALVGSVPITPPIPIWSPAASSRTSELPFGSSVSVSGRPDDRPADR